MGGDTLMDRAPRDDEDFAGWIGRLRQESGLSQRQLAEQSSSDISKSYIGYIENRAVLATDLTLKKLITLSKILKVSIEVMLSAALNQRLNLSSPRATKTVKIPLTKGLKPKERTREGEKHEQDREK